ncbi:MAG: hypothetical protein UU20_C0004G0014 [Parcubacteria group bacterium GW2011_GWE2_40_8]|nr:MAG: hypothetical protein UU20_C0004G0014 [Parcubacteria group bacterium GW2011_GWE2_40_8]
MEQEQKINNLPVFAQLSDLSDQQPVTTDPVPVKFNTNDFISGVKHNEENNPEDIEIVSDGIYFIVAAGQVGRTSGSLLRFIDLWLSVNDRDVPNSNVRASVPSSLVVGDTYVLVCQAVMPFKAGDIIKVMKSVSAINNGMGLLTTKPLNEPVIPSIIFSMYRV